ncbi:MAG TPA: adenylosuccinate lyase [Victivallales bacterium]|nr:adenylosuccinate lyase [Victivallales bacterium]HPO90679.1 adenylosuccinate lyase [Victivallales bacterium]HRU00418.1 adenylosuccinate lyase [Victivallales bacterium]
MQVKGNKFSYETPLCSRYSNGKISYIWSAQNKHSLWRKLWVELARAEKELGIPIKDEQIKEMESKVNDIDFDAVAKKEAELRHDVMSHIHVFGEQCPKAKPIIHLGATSCFVTDNSELIQIRDSLEVIQSQLLLLINSLANFAMRYKALPILAFTHLQPAQPTTLGKRFALYTQDFFLDFKRLEMEIKNLPFRGVKGTTGTQASFMELFNGNEEKIKILDAKIANAFGFKKSISLSGQTYTRKIDYFILSLLSGIAQSAHKIACDIRLMAHMREVEEPFGKKQIGSSAMAYKRNPMKCERICSLARYVMSLPVNAATTHSIQWFERTLDDSANRRIILPEAFLSAGIILSNLTEVIEGLQVWEKVIENNLKRELPFMATENILMAAVKEGGDRQELHEAIRRHSIEAARQIKEFGIENDLIERIKNDKLFNKVAHKIDKLLNPKNFIGRAASQVEDFIKGEIEPLLKKNSKLLDKAKKEKTVSTV